MVGSVTGNHANPTNCPGDQIIYVNQGDTINQIAIGMGGMSGSEGSAFADELAANILRTLSPEVVIIYICL